LRDTGTGEAKRGENGRGGFAPDLEAIRRRAREEMMQGPVTSDYGLDAEHVIGLLDAVVATEMVCALRYWNHAFVAHGFRAEIAAKEFREHAAQELEHMMWIAERIHQLGGHPDFQPATLAERAHAEYVPGKDLQQMLEENLVAERVAIQLYRELAKYLGERDPTSRRLIERILEQEEEHADDMVNLLQSFR
jgi:bacterioferritin